MNGLVEIISSSCYNHLLNKVSYKNHHTSNFKKLPDLALVDYLPYFYSANKNQ